MRIIEIYKAMKARRLCTSKEEFSQRWLAMSQSYYGVQGERTGTECLLILWQGLQDADQDDLAFQVFEIVRRRIERRHRLMNLFIKSKAAVTVAAP